MSVILIDVCMAVVHLISLSKIPTLVCACISKIQDVVYVKLKNDIGASVYWGKRMKMLEYCTVLNCIFDNTFSVNRINQDKDDLRIYLE